MSQAASVRPASYVLRLEEIGHLAAETGKPAETLMNVVALIARRFLRGGSGGKRGANTPFVPGACHLSISVSSDLPG